MVLSKVLVANRGEIAVRLIRGAADFGLKTVAVYSSDDAASLHVRKADEAFDLGAEGAAAYLDMDRIVAVALESGCDSIHPGYGFLSENAEFARRCAAKGLRFIGPSPEVLALFGDKVRARALAASAGVPVLRGSDGPVTLEGARAFFESLDPGGAMMLKAVAGGGGRGSRAVESMDALESAYNRCRSEAQASFGNGDVYAEQLVPRARHIEVQVIGDGSGAVSHLWERECSLQRRYQKIVEVAPAPALAAGLRERITSAAVRAAQAAKYSSLGTFEFLVDTTAESEETFYFIEANARLQVEHTVTEEVLGLDLVRIQLQLASGHSLADLGLTQADVPSPRGFAMQARVNMERMEPDGTTKPAGGTLTAFEVPSGPGLRTDTFGYAGYTTSPRFDSLLAKVIAHTPSADFRDVVAKTYRALGEFRIEGVATNIDFLQTLLLHPAVAEGRVHTRFVEESIGDLLAPGAAPHRRLYAPSSAAPGESARRLAGAKVDAVDPLAVLSYGRGGGGGAPAASAAPQAARPAADWGKAPDGTVAVAAPVQGTVVTIDVAPGDAVRVGQQVLVMEAMKMEHVISAAVSGYVREIAVEVGDAVFEGHPLVFVEPAEVGGEGGGGETAIDLDHVRPDLQLIHDRHAATLDAARPDAVERRRKTNQRTARENVDDLVDAGSWVETGSLVLTPATGLPMETVISKFATDGMVTGFGSINGELFPGKDTRAAVLAYDYSVLAGTQGPLNHIKTDRMLELAEKWRVPVVLFTEGGGGRAGTGGNRTGGSSVSGGGGGGGEFFGGRPLDTPTFSTMARLSGTVPVIGINSGRCFAGNAALLGCCDVIIATEDSNIGMGGPAMIEGGNLGVFLPEEVGPMSVQVPNGVVDIAVKDEAEAVKVARQYLSYFQGPVQDWDCADQRHLRNCVPENRLRIYDVRKVIETLADSGSFLELRRDYGLGMVTGFVRIEGRPMGLIANNPSFLAGAIDSDGSDKAARFMQLLDAFDIPLLVLCDTPGMMVGPEVEKTALVRHCSRLFVTGANLTVPMFTVVLRKAYGLGAQAMTGGSFKDPFFAVAWPTAEFGGMGLEGQVKLGFRNELANIEDPAARRERYETLVARAYERSRAIHQGVSFQVDDVIDPADTRFWIANGLRTVPPAEQRRHKKRPNVDTW